MSKKTLSKPWLFAVLFLVILSQGFHAAAGSETEKTKKRPLLGLTTENRNNGLFVKIVTAESGAANAGIKVNDEIIVVQDQKVKSPKDLFEIVQKLDAGAEVRIVLRRGSKELTVRAILGSRPDSESVTDQPAPAFSLPIFGTSNLFTLKPGKVTIVYFWATWCKYCEPISKELEARVGPGLDSRIQVVAMTSEDGLTIQQFYKTYHPPYAILIDSDAQTSLKFGVSGMPGVAIIDKAGIIRYSGSFPAQYFNNILNYAQELAEKP